MTTIEDLLTTRDIAEHYRVTTKMIQARARMRGIEPARIVGSAYLWLPDQLAEFAPGPVGRPPKKKK